MTCLVLIRHADNDYVGRALAGRLGGVHLNPEGHAQAAALAERLAGYGINRIVSSPLERALETAAPLAERLGLAVETDARFSEVEFGHWEGLAFRDLDATTGWRRYNAFRSGTLVPGGEPSVAVQARMAGALLDIAADHPQACVAVVSHADPIRLAVAYFAGIPIDLMLRLEISPASVSVVQLWDEGVRILCVNHTGVPPAG